MRTVDKISQQVNQLPEPFQEKVLHFIEFLINKTKRENSRKDDIEWFNLSFCDA